MSRTFADALPVSSGPREEERTATQVVAKAERWLGLDLFRFAAVCLMVQGHVFTTLLDQTTKAQGWYPHHAFLHGYTAPMFLLGSGLAFGYTTFRKWDDHARGGPAVKKRFIRYAWLLVIGYGLHLPTLSISQLLSIDDPARLARMLQVDVLQHIGVSLAIAQALVFLVKDRRVFVGVIAALTLLSVFFAPAIWALDVSSLPIWLQGYVNAGSHSYFPLVPWSGFTYGGILVAYLVGIGRGKVETSRPADAQARTKRPSTIASVSERAAWPFLVLSLLLMLVPIVIDRFGGLTFLPPHNFWKTNPLFFFWRLGNVLFVLSILCFAERGMRKLGWLDGDGGARLVRALLPWLKLIAAETLVIYVAHLLVLHGSVFGPGLKHLITEHSQGVGVASAVTVALFLAMVLLAKAWNELRKHPTGYAVMQMTLVGVVLLIALVR